MTFRVSEQHFDVRHRVINKLRVTREQGLPLAASQADLPHGAAMLAVAVVHDSTAGRLIDNARVALGEDPESLALALASNVPAQTERARPKTRRRRVKAHPAGTPAVAAVKTAVKEVPPPTAAPSKANEASEATEEGEEAGASEATPLSKAGEAPPSRSKRRRRRRRKRRDAEVATTGDTESADEADTRLAAG